MSPWLTVVGIGEDGFSGLGKNARRALLGASRVFGSQRQLDLLPPCLRAERHTWPSPFSLGPVLVTDYAFRRFNGHCDDAERLVSALRPGHEAELPAAVRLAEESHQRDDLFPDPIPAVEAALAGTRTLALD